MRQVLIYWGEEGLWIAECPSLPGCVTQGQSQQEAIKNIKDAIKLYLETFEKDHLPVPEERFNAMLIVV